MNRLSFRPVALLAAFALGLAACGPGQDKEGPKPKVVLAADLRSLGPAPAWQLEDVDGNLVSFEQFKGKVVVVDFWATWCVPCKAEIPGYIEMTKKHGESWLSWLPWRNDDLVIIGMSADQAGAQVVKDFIKKEGMNYPVVMLGDSMDKIASAFGGIESIPTTFLIDRTGQIRHKKVGVEAAADYEQKILALLR